MTIPVRFFHLSTLFNVRLMQGSQTRGPRGRFVRPAMLSGNFQVFNSCQVP